MKEASGDTTRIIPEINSQGIISLWWAILWITAPANVQFTNMFFFKGVQVDLVNLLDLKMLQGDSDEDSSEGDMENGEDGEETSKDRDGQKEHTLRS